MYILTVHDVQNKCKRGFDVNFSSDSTFVLVLSCAESNFEKLACKTTSLDALP